MESLLEALEWRLIVLRYDTGIRSSNVVLNRTRSDSGFFHKYLSLLTFSSTVGLTTLHFKSHKVELQMRLQLKHVNIYDKFTVLFTDNKTEMHSVAYIILVKIRTQIIFFFLGTEPYSRVWIVEMK
jgi:hypothetical protein